ncbi:CLC_0170 family protein [Paenibacillus humicola]|uniref:CLC_0170 family protein n=1 Tax=Paenibacillus humicola TaxID=3110540 RepID=UPI00237B297E|nr:CLC_0170 family protein [Paenibacillus humicola]
MQFGGGIGYIGFIVTLMLITGILTLRIDTKRYEVSGMKREQKAARIVGWFNVVIAIGIYIGNWVIHKFA